MLLCPYPPFVADCDTPAPCCSMLLCPYPPSTKVQTTNLMLGYHLFMVTWYFISQSTNQIWSATVVLTTNWCGCTAW
jgi:hypothetical protein